MSAIENIDNEVDIKTSIATRRLIFKTGLFDLFLAYLIDTVLIAIVLDAAWEGYKQSVLITIPLVALGIWLVLNAILLTKLVKIEGGRKKREVIIKLIEREFANLEMVPTDQEDIIKFIKYTQLFKGGKMITILFDSSDAYINIISLGRNDSYSPFHGWFNFVLCKEKARALTNLR